VEHSEPPIEFKSLVKSSLLPILDTSCYDLLDWTVLFSFSLSHVTPRPHDRLDS
jgi:hypothetical protein